MNVYSSRIVTQTLLSCQYLNVYSHMLPNEHYGSAERLGEIVFGQGNDVSNLTSDG